jgi:hypothetical protein
MLESRKKGFVVRKAFKKERLKNAKWDVHVYKPEVKRLEDSIVRLEKKCKKIVRRLKDISEKMYELDTYR